SIWVQVPNISSGKGKPIYAAIRVIDNGGMLNVNTGYVFDPCNSVGSSQMDINFVALSALDNTHTASGEKQNRLLAYRCGSESSDIGLYEQKVVWQYGLPIGAYTPFDISDELKLRNRYIINYNQDTSRIESLWTNAFDGQPYVPRDTTIKDANWTWVTYNYYPASCPDPNIYDNRHIATIQNLDRVINPSGQKMVNINTEPNVIRIRDAILAGFVDANVISDVNVLNGLATQITANLIDYRDSSSDSNVTVIYDSNGVPHFGFETPCVYISEIAESNVRTGVWPMHFYQNSYAIELYKPYWEDPLPSSDPCNGWQLVVGTNPPININWTGSNRFHVIEWSVAGAPITPEFNDVNGIDANAHPQSVPSTYLAFSGGELVKLWRRIPDGSFVTVDSVVVPEVNTTTGWLVYVDSNSTQQKVRSYQRDISPNKPIRRLWDFAFSQIDAPTLGHANNFVNTADQQVIQAHPANKPFTNVGEFGQLFYHTTYDYGGIIPSGITEPQMRIDLNEPAYQQVFKYLTVMDPTAHITTDPCGTETRVKGRININTAPWFVIAQLPWVSYQLAQAIVDYRNNNGPFKSIGELMRVTDSSNDANSIGYYASQSSVPSVLMTPADGAGDAFEQRDAIFARISNLVTVRSDVFTAYILVRIGSDGPQKRVIAILDRSGVTPAGGKVKVIAIQQVPDPR
ncbi:MAG: helix-hairpin-helix domain-containing protein, partial [Sedimentisphaerales bacterium]